MTKQELRALLADMSLEEKTGQMVQIPMSLYKGGKSEPTGPMIDFHIDPAQLPLCGSFITDQSPEAAGYAQVVREATAAHPHHIPPILMRDVIHGYRTMFPIPLALGCTFDEGVAETVGRISAGEATACGIHATFAPMVDVVRDPRWGRVMESPGESVKVCAAMGAAMVRGFRQGDPRKEGAMGTCAKHFAAYGLCQAGKDYAPIDVSRTEMYNVYLPPFKAALDAGCDMIMPAFVMIDRVPCVCNAWLLRDVLRDQWHSDAMVISDYADVAQLMPHGVAEDRREAAMMSVEGGTDMDMVCYAYLTELPGLVRDGLVDEKLIDEACWRVLVMKNNLGLFENPVWNDDPAVQAAAMDRPESRQAALEAALKSCVLLENDGILPLKPGVKIALVGDHADTHSILGGWTLDADWPSTETVTSAFRRDDRVTLCAPEEADVILYAVGEDEKDTGEGGSKAHPELTKEQMDELRRLHALGKPVVMLLFCGRPLILTEALSLCAAVLNVWFPGTMGAEAIRQLVMGDANPSGHLSITFPRALGQIPIHHDRLTTSRPENPNDHYTNRYLDENSAPLYPFGYGLSYTSFDVRNTAVSTPIMTEDAPLEVTAEIVNTGDRPGETVVQLYARIVHSRLVRPEKMIIAWQRVHLAPGEIKHIALPVTADALRMYDHSGEPVHARGEVRLAIGLNSNAPMTLSVRCESTGYRRKTQNK